MMGFVDFGEIPLTKKVGELKNVVLNFLADGFVRVGLHVWINLANNLFINLREY